MRISAFFMPFFAIIAGAAGFYLRLTELLSVFDARGLPERGAGITFVLAGLSVAYLLVVFVFALRAGIKFTAPQGFNKAFGVETPSYPTVFFFIGILWFGGTIKHFLDLNAGGDIPLSELCFSVLSALSAISVSLFAFETYQDRRLRSRLALCAVPTLFMCFWLMLFYRQNASNPILLSYCYQCLAIISSALGFYFTSGFVYNRPTPGKAIFAYYAAIFFCLVTLADEHDLSVRIIFIAIITINVIHSSMLLKNMHRRAD